MIINRTVYLLEGGTKVCEYDTEKSKLAVLWITLAAIIYALDLFAVIGNIIVIVACALQKKKTALIVYIQALAVCDLIFAVAAAVTAHR